jgi:hypothetical protein
MLVKSALVTQMSGSIGGLTATRNRAGMVLRARALPVNPGSAYQAVVRNHLSNLAAYWLSDLTAAQRAAWELYAQNTSMLGKLGDPVQLTGQQHFIRANAARLQASLTQVDDAPTDFVLAVGTLPGAIGDAGDDQILVAFDNTDEWANEEGGALLVLGSPPQNVTINYYRGPYRYIGKVDGDAVTPPTSPEAFDLPWPIAEGQRCFVHFRFTRADGRLSTPIRLQADVQA